MSDLPGITIIKLNSGSFLALGEDLFKVAKLLKEGKIPNRVGVGDTVQDAYNHLLENPDTYKVLKWLNENSDL